MSQRKRPQDDKRKRPFDHLPDDHPVHKLKRTVEFTRTSLRSRIESVTLREYNLQRATITNLKIHLTMEEAARAEYEKQYRIVFGQLTALQNKRKNDPLLDVACQTPSVKTSDNSTNTDIEMRSKSTLTDDVNAAQRSSDARGSKDERRHDHHRRRR